MCFKAIDDPWSPNTVFATDRCPLIQTVKRFKAGVRVRCGVSPTKVVDGKLTISGQSRNTWILLELNSSDHPSEECCYRSHDFRPGSVSWMLKQTSAGALKDSLVSFNVDLRCSFIHQDAKCWTPSASQPVIKGLGEFGVVRSFYKYVNRYFAVTKDFVSADTQNYHFRFEDATARKAPCLAYFRYTYSMPPSCAEYFYQVVRSHTHFIRGDFQIMPDPELRGDHSFLLIPTRETMQKHPGEMSHWEIMGTLMGQTKPFGLTIISTLVRGTFSIFCAMDTCKVIPSGTLSPLQMVVQTLFHDGGLLLFSVQNNRLVRFTSGTQCGSGVWIKGLTTGPIP